MSIDLAKIHSVIFSGGGSRCLWQAGFWQVLKKTGRFEPTIIGSTSAGTTMACMLLAGKTGEALSYFKEETSKNKKNAYFSNIFNSKPVFPHYRIYRQAIMEVFDEQALKRLRTGPEIRVMIARPPRWLGARSGSFIGIALYSIEKLIKYPVHPTFGIKFGYRPLVVRVSECKTVEDLADLLLQASCTPPFVPVLYRGGRPALDGGLIDNVPVSLADESAGMNLVLLSRQYPTEILPIVPNRLYVQPSRPVSISKWDYTSPEGLQEAYDFGLDDGEKFLKNSSVKADRIRTA